MKDNPLVSVLIPVYNAGNYLRPALKSIIEQTYSNLEIIIIDDGSTDGCIDTITGIKDSRIRIVSHENAGKSAALNQGLDKLNGDYYLIQDADDLSYSTRVEKQLSFLKSKPKLAAVYVGHDLLIRNRKFAPIFSEKNPSQCRDGIKKLQIPAHDATGMYRMSMVKDMRFEEKLQIGQGVDYVLRVGEKYPVKVLGECLYTYRINYNSTIRRNPSKTIDNINIVLRRACDRQGLDFEKFRISPPKVNRLFKHRDFDMHIIAHCMESVLNLRNAKQISEALKTAMICIRLHLYDPYYYKPLAYFLAPLSLIRYYRFKKDQFRR